MNKYAILQLKDTYAARELQFESFKWLQEHGKYPEPKDYKFVYAGVLDDPGYRRATRLDYLYVMFNVAIPDDFEGHSMSISDIIAVLEGEQIRYYYVDSRGFQDLDSFKHLSCEVALRKIKIDPPPKKRHIKFYLEDTAGEHWEIFDYDIDTTDTQIEKDFQAWKDEMVRDWWDELSEEEAVWTKCKNHPPYEHRTKEGVE